MDKFSLYNEEVFLALTKHLIKKGQEAPIQSIDPRIVKTLSDKLYRELNGLPAELVIDTDNDIKLDQNTLKDFGTFLQTLMANNVTVNGNRLVYPDNVSDEIITNKKLGIITSSYTRNTDEGRKLISKEYYIDGNSMRAYIESLKELTSREDMPNMLTPYINTLIIDFNKAYQDDPITPVKRKTPIIIGITNETVVDFIHNKMFNSKIPLQSIGTISVGTGVMTAKDISTGTAFNNWLMSGAKIQINDALDNFGTDPNKTSKYRCIILNIMLQRANYLISNVTTEERKTASKYYYDSITSLMSQFNCPVDKSITKIIPGIETGVGAEKGIGTSTPIPGQDLTAQQKGELTTLTNQAYLPLSMDNIDLPKIKRFKDMYFKFIINYFPGLKKDIISDVTKIDHVINVIETRIMNPGETFGRLNLRSDPEGIMPSLQGNVANFVKLCDLLNILITYAAKLTMSIDANFGEQGKIPQARNRVKNQSGRILTQNKGRLYSWKNNPRFRVGVRKG